jgi:chaperonin cofactor prefoldin
MQINGADCNSTYNPGAGNPQSDSIEQKIEKLEDRKRKIQEDLATRSNNPDPKAAQGDNAANSAVNRKILEQLELQIQTLEQRRDGIQKNMSEHNPVNNSISAKNNKLTGNHVDVFA